MCKCNCKYVHTHMQACMHACMSVHVRIRVIQVQRTCPPLSAYIHTYVHANIHTVTYIHTSMRVHMNAHTYTTWIEMQLSLNPLFLLPINENICILLYVYIYTYTYRPDTSVCMHTYLSVLDYMYLCTQMNTHTCMHACMRSACVHVINVHTNTWLSIFLQLVNRSKTVSSSCSGTEEPK